MKVFWIILIILLALFILTIIGCFWLTSFIRKSVLGHRYIDDNTLHYFGVEDFANLKVKNVKFKSDKNDLAGYFYYSDKANIKGIIILSHGIGAGHIQYMTEINYFVNNDYLVFAYDVRGCLNSTGKGIIFFQNAIKDLNAAIDYVKRKKELCDYKLFLFGHSLGGYSVNNISYFRKDISAIVSMSGFNSSNELFLDFMKPLMGNASKLMGYFLNLEEKIRLQRLANINSIDSLSNTSIPTLLISGDRDNIVNPQNNFYRYKKMLSDNKNISFYLVEGRYHRPNITKSASEYDLKVNQEISSTKMKYKNKIPQDVSSSLYNSFDYNKLVELDLNVMQDILKFFEAHR